jgi:hypothetical protein
MITVDDVYDLAQGSLPNETLANKSHLIQMFIDNASGAVERHIGRKMGVVRYREAVDPRDWVYSSLGWSVTTAKWPVTQCDGAKAIGQSFVVFDERPDFITYRAGWVTAPADVRMVLFNLSMYEINRARNNTYNFTTKTIVTGSTVANVSKSPEDFYRDELKRLDLYVQMSSANVEELPDET